jgi:lysyl-tRNA synthetase class 2
MQEWWRPDRFALRRAMLDKRGRILAAIRSFFADRGFVEVDTPALPPCAISTPRRNSR